MHSQNIRIRTYQCIELPCYKIACSKYIKVKPFWLRFFSVAFHYTHSNSLYKIKWKKKKHKISTTTTKNPKAIDHLDVVSWSQCKMSVRNYIHIHTVRCVYVLFHSVWCTFFVSTLYFIQFFFCVSTLTKKERQMKLFWERPTKR